MYYDSLPYYVYLKNKKVIINADYHIFIEFEEEMQGKDIKSAVEKALTRFYPAFYLITENNLIDEAVEKFIWFYFCGKEYLPTPTKKQKAKKTSQIYSYKHDSDFEFVKIKSYRAYDGKDEEMLELKEYYKLPPTEAEIKDKVRQDKIYEALK